MRNDPVSTAIRVDEHGPGHTHVSVFAGRNEGARGHAGVLTFRTDEWDELVREGVGLDGHSGKLVLVFDALSPLMIRRVDGVPVAFDGEPTSVQRPPAQTWDPTDEFTPAPEGWR